jgi:hypothetical protein
LPMCGAASAIPIISTTRTTLVQNPFPVDHCDNQRLALSQSVNNAIAVNDKLPHVFVVKLGNHATCLREARQNPRLVHNALQNCAGIGGRISADVVSDRF